MAPVCIIAQIDRSQILLARESSFIVVAKPVHVDSPRLPGFSTVGGVRQVAAFEISEVLFGKSQVSRILVDFLVDPRGKGISEKLTNGGHWILILQEQRPSKACLPEEMVFSNGLNKIEVKNPFKEYLNVSCYDAREVRPIPANLQEVKAMKWLIKRK